MKKILQIPLLLVALFLTSIPISAHDFEIDGIYYNILSSTDRTAAVTFKGYNYDSYSNEYTGIVSIPSTVLFDDTIYSITSIGNHAFWDCDGLTSVTIPNSVTAIGDGAFGGCFGLAKVNITDLSAWCKINFDRPSSNPLYYAKKLKLNGTEITNLVIPDDINGINAYAFYSYSGLTSVTIPNSVTSIGSSAFEYCSGLTEVNISDLSAWCKISFGSYANPLYCAKKLKLNGTEITNLVIPDDITKIKANAFSGCTSLTSVIIHNSVTSIGGSAFEGCTGLTSVTIGNSVTSIGSGAFNDCSGLTEVNFNAENCTTIDSYYGSLFENCINLKTINIGNNVNIIPNYVFRDCSSLTSVTIPNSVTEIGSWAFDSCTGLTLITIGNSVTTIGDYAFNCCAGLTEVNFNATNCTYMPSSVFTSCNIFNTLNIGENVKNIPKNAFRDCTGLTSITIPNSVTSIGYSAFEGCTGLTEVNISDLSAWCKIDFANTESNPLYYARHLKLNGTEITSLVIPNDVNEIKAYTFYRCSGLTGELTIPNSVTSIGSSAFRDCTNLTSLQVSNSVKTIGAYAFSGCTKLLYDPKITTTQTTATLTNITTPTTYSPYIEYNSKYYKVGDKITGLKPGNSTTFDYGLIINDNYCRIKGVNFTTLAFDAYLSGSATASSVTAKGTYTEGDVTILGEGINCGNKVSEYDGKNTIKVNNLDPNNSYTIYYAVKTQEGGVYSTYKTFTTSALELTTQEAKPTSTTSARLLAATNCDATEGTGFEWRPIDAPEIIPSNKVNCPVVDGVLVGTLRGVKDDVYYMYRPYYTSSSGNTYYGEWVGFYTADANVYFEPEVRTYDDIQVINNSATVKGYALEGTDVITAQGFEYWKTGNTITPSSTENRMIVSASGISMSATLANLEYNSTYKYRAFVTTAKGTTYGDEVEFSTGNDPAGIDYIEIDANEFSVTLRENPATGTAWLKIAGAAGEEVQYTITSMSGAMIATGTIMLDGEWNAIDLNCSTGMYLLTINDGTQVKTLRLIVK